MRSQGNDTRRRYSRGRTLIAEKVVYEVDLAAQLVSTNPRTRGKVHSVGTQEPRTRCCFPGGCISADGDDGRIRCSGRVDLIQHIVERTKASMICLDFSELQIWAGIFIGAFLSALGFFVYQIFRKY